MRTEKIYEGFAYRQSQNPEAPWLVSFVASAEELTLWAGIPRRASDKFIGFQRTEDPVRVDRARDFFNLGINQSPTALIVGLHPALPGDQRIFLDFLDNDHDEPVRKCRLRVLFEDSPTLDDVRVSIKKQVEKRLSGDQSSLDAEGEEFAASNLPSLGGLVDEEPMPEEELLDSTDLGLSENDASEESVGSDSIATDASDSEDIELGRSLLTNLLDALEDPDWCSEHVDDLVDIAKPATIIDGQHRALAARACERNIPFMVCAIYNCPWPEQVFQFTVVNYTARGIPDQFITANAALSLTKSELGSLRSRLVQAGVKVVEYELMKIVQFDSRSPFYDLVNLTDRKDNSKIGYKTMVRLAKRWYNANHQAFTNLLPHLYPDIKGGNAKRRQRERWKEEDWGEFFLDFWAIIYRTYSSEASHNPGHTLWEVGHSNLIVAIVLFELQEAFLNNLNQQDEEFFEVKEQRNAVDELRDKLRKRAEKFVTWIPVDFFGTKWGLGGQLNVGPGRDALQTALDNLVKKKGAYQYGKSTLVTGKTE